jgi:hypothetical protein
MAETVLVRALTAEMIAGGEALLRRLDQEEIPIVAAFWLYSEESARWKLFMATPLVGKVHMTLVYRKVHGLLAELGEQQLLGRVTFRRPTDPDVEFYGRQVFRGRLPKNLIEHIDCGTWFIYRFVPLRLPSR